VYVDCEVCHGKRYNRDTLAVHYKGKNIAEVLEMPIAEAPTSFEPIQAIHRLPQDAGRSSPGAMFGSDSPPTTLSGGEAQRVKLATELPAPLATAGAIYVPSTSPRPVCTSRRRPTDSRCSSLVEKGNTVIVIEHNLDVIKSVRLDHRPGSRRRLRRRRDRGDGTPEQVARVDGSFTGAIPSRRLLVLPRAQGRLTADGPSSRPHRALQAAAGGDPHEPGRLPFRGRSGARALRRQGEEPRARLSNYFAPAAHPARTHPADGHERGIRRVDGRGQRRRLAQLEYMWIKEFDPPFNVRYKDDKSYPFMAITLADEAPASSSPAIAHPRGEVLRAVPEGVGGARHDRPMI
jgi:hypothetical protein